MICNYVFLEKKKQWMNEYICIFNYIYMGLHTHVYIYIYKYIYILSRTIF